MTRAWHLGVCASALLASPIAAQVAAQGAGQASTEPAADRGVQDIIVTAERRAANLQDVPIAATALTGDQLAAKSVQRMSDLQFAAPSLSITDQGLTQSVNIRGIGIASGSPAVANGVAVYLDGVFQPPILTMSSFYDIGSVEVLRGPQGTLVGSNSTGGAIFINTQVPTLDRIKGYAQAHYGSYSAYGFEGAINFPLADTVAIRVAGNTRWRDSYFTDIGPYDNKPDRLDEQAVRLGVLWEPGAFRALGRVEWIDKNTGGYAYRPIEGTAFDSDRQDDPRTLTYNAPTLNHERGFLSSLELRYELDGGTVLRAVTGWSNKRVNNLYDTDASRLAVQTQDQFVREKQFSQEINIISPTDGAFNWIVGGYLQKNKIKVDIQNRTGIITDPTDIDISQDKETLGVFAQTGYRLSEQLEVQFGLRYSHFRADSGGSVVIGAGGPIFGPAGLQVADLAGTHSDGRVTGKLALNWNVSDDHLVYAFVARGYKPGGSNSAISEFGPETVWDYEFGWKGNLLDNHLRTQLGVFYMRYSDFQFDKIDVSSGQTGVTNIASANIKGLEFQTQARFGGFSIDGGFAFVDSSLDEIVMVNSRLLPPIGQFGPQCPPGTPSNPPVCFDYGPYTMTAGGGQNLFSPRWSWNIGAEYEIDLGGGLTFTPRVNYAYIGSRWVNLFYDPQLDYLPGRGLLSAQVSLRKDGWSIDGYVTNLADKLYVSGQSGNNEFYGAPREFGVRISTRF